MHDLQDTDLIKGQAVIEWMWESWLWKVLAKLCGVIYDYICNGCYNLQLKVLHMQKTRVRMFNFGHFI
jgi:hypothetical protein